jgi:hypothetical protein
MAPASVLLLSCTFSSSPSDGLFGSIVESVTKASWLVLNALFRTIGRPAGLYIQPVAGDLVEAGAAQTRPVAAQAAIGALSTRAAGGTASPATLEEVLAWI